MKKYIKKYYKELLLLLVILTFSLLNMKKAYLLNSSFNRHLTKQILWIVIGIILYIFTYKIKFKHLFKFKTILYIFNIIMLIYVLIFSKSINGIKAWINIGIFNIQPSEFIKITFTLLSIDLVKKKKYLINLIIYLIPSLLILLEPDTGNFIILTFLFIYILLNKYNKKYLYIFIILTILTSLIFLLLIKYNPKIIINTFNGSLYYRYKRLVSINNNYQIRNSLIGISNSKLIPIDLKNIIIYIPEGITDFIFAFNICNYGIILSIILVICYFLLTYFIYKRINKYNNFYKKKLIGSFLVIFIFQYIYNMMMNIGLLPIMGIPLPFLSYGGSNIISYFILYALTKKKISSIEDMDNNNYMSNFRKVLVDKHNYYMGMD